MMARLGNKIPQQAKIVCSRESSAIRKTPSTPEKGSNGVQLLPLPEPGQQGDGIGGRSDRRAAGTALDNKEPSCSLVSVGRGPPNRSHNSPLIGERLGERGPRCRALMTGPRSRPPCVIREEGQGPERGRTARLKRSERAGRKLNRR